jgi:hypothetical protein
MRKLFKRYLIEDNVILIMLKSMSMNLVKKKVYINEYEVTKYQNNPFQVIITKISLSLYIYILSYQILKSPL